MPAAFLPNRSHFTVSGVDAQEFLQGLITTDVDGLASGYAAPGALLTPQGKIMFYFMISRTSDGFSIETSSDSVDALAKRLTMYKLRAKVDIGAQEAMGTSLLRGDDETADALKDIRFEKAGIELFRKAGGTAGDADAFDALRVEAMVLEPGIDFALNDVFPHDIMLDLNGGLSFKKGCYVGQEVVSRMQHRSTARRRPVKVIAESALPGSETPITVDGKSIGALGTVSNNTGLAIVRIDKAGAATAAGKPILVGDLEVSLSLAPWSGLAFPKTDEGE